MAECNEIGLMLGAFEDGELEPNEMQEVAYHLARCENCTSILTDYSSLGRELRAITTTPELSGFSRAVIARIDRLPQPWYLRIERWMQRTADSLGSGLAWGGAVVAVAVLTIILLSPYAQKYSNRNIASTITSANQLAKVDVPTIGEPAINEPAMADSDSHADISRLESDNPSMAVWSEPHNGTTVIWLPDQH